MPNWSAEFAQCNSNINHPLCLHFIKNNLDSDKNAEQMAWFYRNSCMNTRKLENYTAGANSKFRPQINGQPCYPGYPNKLCLDLNADKYTPKSGEFYCDKWKKYIPTTRYKQLCSRPGYLENSKICQGIDNTSLTAICKANGITPTCLARKADLDPVFIESICVNNLEQPICRDVSQAVLNAACAKKLTATCTNRKNELYESTMNKLCPANLSKPICACYRAAPSFIPAAIRGQTKCWDQECATVGYLPTNMRNSTCNIKVCTQQIPVVGNSNTFTKNYISQDCSDHITVIPGTTTSPPTVVTTGTINSGSPTPPITTSITTGSGTTNSGNLVNTNLIPASGNTDIQDPINNPIIKPNGSSDDIYSPIGESIPPVFVPSTDPPLPSSITGEASHDLNFDKETAEDSNTISIINTTNIFLLILFLVIIGTIIAYFTGSSSQDNYSTLGSTV